MKDLLYKTVTVPLEVLTDLFGLINAKENVTLEMPPRSGATYFWNTFKDESFLKHHLTKSSNYVFLNLDLSLDKDLLIEQLKQEVLAQSSKSNYIQGLKELSSSKYVYLILDNVNRKNENNLKFIVALKSINLKKIKFIFITGEVDLKQLQLDQIGNILFSNILKSRYFTKKESFEWLNKILEDFDTEKRFTPTELENIYVITGGIPSLMRHFARMKYRDISFREALESEEFDIKVQDAWNNLTTEEQRVVSSLVANGSYDKEDEHVYKYLYDMNFFASGKVGEWVNKILKTHSDINLKIQGSKILFNGFDISHLLTNNQNKILKALIQSEGFFLSRNKIAELLWGNAITDQTTEYAIDQTISRLKKKFKDLGIQKQILFTKKGRGIYLKL